MKLKMLDYVELDDGRKCTILDWWTDDHEAFESDIEQPNGFPTSTVQTSKVVRVIQHASEL